MYINVRSPAVLKGGVAIKSPFARPCGLLYGFTLVELLVVISIIALLLSILMPTLSQARKQAQSVVCKTNLKTVGQAELMYAQENDGTCAWIRNDSSGQCRYWAGQLFAHFYKSKIPEYGDVGAKRYEKSWLTCPAQPIRPKEVWNDVNLFVGGGYSEWWLLNICYTRNGFSGKYGWYQPPVIQPPIKLAKITRPSSVADVVDGHHYVYWGNLDMTNLYKSWRDGSYNAAWFEGGTRTTSYRHQKGEGLNLLLWDGHVEQVRKSIAESGFILMPKAYQ